MDPKWYLLDWLAESVRLVFGFSNFYRPDRIDSLYCDNENLAFALGVAAPPDWIFYISSGASNVAWTNPKRSNFTNFWRFGLGVH